MGNQPQQPGQQQQKTPGNPGAAKHDFKKDDLDQAKKADKDSDEEDTEESDTDHN